MCNWRENHHPFNWGEDEDLIEAIEEDTCEEHGIFCCEICFDVKEERNWHNEFVLIILGNYDELEFDMLCLEAGEFEVENED